MPRVVVGRGPRALENILYRELGLRIEAARADPRLLERPLRVVVPSRSLRQHVAAELVRRFGSAVVGVAIQTLHALALELLERAGGVPPGGDVLLPVLARTAARAQPALRQRLDDLSDGYAAVEPTLRDLFDAGFRAVHADALDECLAALPERGAEISVARALVAAARDTETELARLGTLPRWALLGEALAVLEATGAAVLPSRAILIHGFSDATGVVTELIRGLQRQCGATVLLDAPPDPGTPARPDASAGFAGRFRERTTSHDRVEIAEPEEGAGASEPVALRGLSAPGAFAEAEAVARHVARLLDAGVRASGICVALRDPSLYSLPVRHHFRRLGVPFSGLGIAGPAGPRERRLAAILELLRSGASAATDALLDAWSGLGAEARADLRSAARQLGAVRVGDAAGLETGRGLDLRVPRGLSAPPAAAASGVSDRAGSLQRRHLSGADLASLAERARAVVDRLAGRPEQASAAQHRDWLRALIEGDLRGGLSGTAERLLLDRLAEELSDIPSQLRLAADDFLLLVERCAARLPAVALGGSGGGVQVLSVTEARGRSFEQLFVMGLNRDVFPRSVREDPLLSDALRRAMAAVLPDIPVKSRGHEEERFLFAQLVASSPQVTLSWQSVADDGGARTRSTLVERLGWAALRLPVDSAPARRSPEAARLAEQPAREAAILAGLHGSRDAWQGCLRRALEASRDAAGALDTAGPAADPAALAAARRAVLDEFERAPREVSDPGPYLGLAGSARGPADPRAGLLSATALERFAKCPWQTFIGRVLRIEVLPDPVESLPAVDRLRLGNLVHDVLERMAREAGVAGRVELASLGTAEPRAVPWPTSGRLESWLRESARALLSVDGADWPGLVEALVRAAQRRLERARELEWGDPGAPPQVIGVEVNGSVEVPDVSGSPRRIRFRADRVDRVEGVGGRDAEWVFSDYKTSRPEFRAKRDETRRRALVAGLRRGDPLQAAAYAFSGVAGAPPAIGRYVHLHPDSEAAIARSEIASSDGEARAAFEASVGVLFAAIDHGSFVPRMFETEGDSAGPACRYCELAEACTRGDSGARMRLRRFVDGGSATLDTERALLGLFDLRRKPAEPAA